MVTNHISICVCTFKRTELLRQLLSRLTVQDTKGLFEYSIVVVDNDGNGSARQTVKSHALQSKISISYHVEPEQNIALARNMAVANVKGDHIAFIDDDELPDSDWLANLYKACETYCADGILGPVLPYFETTPPSWVLRGKFYQRPSHASGTVLEWKFTRTGNVLFKSSILQGNNTAFDPKLGSGGEDRDFFRRMIEKGHKFVWCNEAPVHEVIPAHRCKRIFMLKRGLLRGQGCIANPSYSRLSIITSFVAVPMYTIILPFLFLAGEHVFMKYLIKDCDHLGKILAFFGIKTINKTYITE